MGGALVEAEVLEKQLLSQMLEAVRVTPSLHEDLQVEVMKVRPCNCFSWWLHPLFSTKTESWNQNFDLFVCFLT